MVRAAILAAGASSRMGTPKAGLPLGATGTTFLSRLTREFLAAGLPDVVIVTGAAEESVRQAAGRARSPVRLVHNPDWPTGQLTSVHAALRERHGDHLEAVMVTLVDAPLIRRETIVRLLHAWRVTRAPIVRPARGDEHGHPVIFDRAVFDELRTADPALGAKAVVRARMRDILNVPVDDDGAFIDIDTPDEYQRVVRNLRD